MTAAVGFGFCSSLSAISEHFLNIYSKQSLVNFRSFLA